MIRSDDCYYEYEGKPVVIYRIITNRCGCKIIQYKIGDIKGEWTAYVTPEDLDNHE